MEKNSRRKRSGNEDKSGSSEINMGKNVGPKSSSFCVATSSSNNGDSACTSPVLDTGNNRRSGKTRRVVSDSAYTLRLGKPRTPKEILQIPGVSRSDKNLENSSKCTNQMRCPSCNWVLNDDKICENCSDCKLTTEKTAPCDESLTDRLRSLRRHKKPATTVSDLRDAQISDEKFVGSVRMLDKVCRLAPLAKGPETPKKSLEFLPFVELEHLRLSQLAMQKTEPLDSHLTLDNDTNEEENKSPGFLPFATVESLRLSQLLTQKNVPPVSHLTLDEDNDEDEDMFEDLKDNASSRHEPADTSASSVSSFHGFSSEDCKRSKDSAERSSQLREVRELGEDDTARFRGFTSADIETSERHSQKMQNMLRGNFPDSPEWDDWFIDELDTTIQRNVGIIYDSREGPTSSKARENSGTTACSGKRPGTSEIISKAEVPCVRNTSSNEELGNRRFTADGETRLESREAVSKDLGKIISGFTTAGGRELKISKEALAKSKALFDAIEEPRIEDVVETKTDPVPLKENEGKISSGFMTAGGRELKISQEALAKSKALFDAIEEPRIKDVVETKTDPVPLKENEGKITSGFTTAGGRELKISQEALAKSKALFDAIEEPRIEDVAETRTDPVPLKENDGKISSDFTTAGGRELKISLEALAKSKALFDAIEEPRIEDVAETKTDPVPLKTNDGKISSDFTTAGGRELKISQEAWAMAKAVFDAIDDPFVDDFTETETDPVPQKKNEGKITSGFATAGGRKLKISEESLAKSKAMFDAIEEPCIEEVAENKKKTITSDFSTAGGRTIDVSIEAIAAAEAQFSADLENMKSLDAEDFVDPMEEPEATRKRKFEEIDEETPLRRESSLKRKRGRYVSDLQARKLFDEDPNSDEEVEPPRKTSEPAGSTTIDPQGNLISDEVDASAAALLEDEECSNEATTWQINNPECREDSVSPELGCDVGNRTRLAVTTRNPLGAVNRAELEKVNVDGGRETRYSHATSGSSAETKGNNDRAATSAERKREEPHEIQHESIPDDLMFDTQFSQDIQHSPVIDKFIADAMKIMEGRLAAALKQDEAIRGKRRTKPEPSDGLIYRLRTENRDSRTSWRELTEGAAPEPREICDNSYGCDLPSITADTAERFSFRCADFFGERNVRSNIEGLEVGDGALLILDEKNCASAREFERAFLASPGVDPNLVPTGWVRNHYRWIVWKLASMDRVKFGHKCLPRMLTPNRVMLELKYRYDREIYRMQWPPLRRILERGENASSRLVLCVSSIVAVKEEEAPVKAARTPRSFGLTMYKVRVTDGWYSIGTSVDAAMINFVKSGKVREGTKLMISGAKVMNLDQGCSALEVPEAVTLRIYSNSTRRARWDTKLDFYRPNRGPMSLSLKSVKPNGGAICKMIVAVSRVYPILYREKLPGGQCVFRNARSDEEAARAHEARYQSKMEEIYASAWNEFQITSRKGSGERKRSYTQEEAAACSREAEEELRQRISSKMSECLPTPRDVTPVMKLRIAEDETNALVTVWSTDRDTTELFVEGSTIAIYNSFASGLRSNELQITASRSTFVKRELSRRISYPERAYTSLAVVTEAGFNPVYGEFDTIGVVSSTGPAPHGMKNFETVNLACPRPGDATTSDFLSVLFWQGVSAHGYAKILTVGSLVACSNLEWRKNISRSIPTAYCTDRSVFSKNPRQSHLVEYFESLRDEIKEPLAYATACAAVIEEEIAKKSALRTPGGGGCGTPYRPATYNSRTPGWSPRDATCSIDANFSTPRNDSRKTPTTRERLERLEAYGEAPKLPAIVINNSSRKVLSDFQSPVRTPVTKP